MPVILCHAGFSWIQGGYVGVDVFFVISGYLITGVIRDELAAGRFSLIDFYERRVRRIIPALLLVTIATLLAGAVLFLPMQLQSLGHSAFSVLTFTSNFWFRSRSGYFSDVALLQPLLHSWSLGVEEQYYILFPLALLLLRRLRLPLLPAVLAVLAASFALAAFLVHRMPGATFYLLPTRAWELMIGAALALGTFSRFGAGRPAIRELLVVAGLLLIAVPAFTYTEDTVFPGLAALPPCLGAALIILAVQQGSPTAAKLLGARLPVFIGLISYSLYLWHWPIFVFSRQLLLDLELDTRTAMLGILLTILLSLLSWRYVETPFRDRARLGRRTIFAGSAVTAVAVAAMAGAASTGLADRLPAETVALAAGERDVPREMRDCRFQEASLAACQIGAARPPSFAVWGDSYSAALSGAVSIVARGRGRGGILYAFNSCAPGIGAHAAVPGFNRGRCEERNRLVLQRLASDRSITTVVLIAAWPVAVDPAYAGVVLEPAVRSLIAADKDVVILADLPEPEQHAPWAAAMSSYYGRRMPVTVHSPKHQLIAALARRTGARLIPLSPAFCRDRHCPVQHRGRVLYTDDDHVSGYANRVLVAPHLERSGLFRDSGSH